MAFDEKLAERIRALLADRDDVEEKRMIGGLTFMVSGKMSCGIMADGLLARVPPEVYDDALTRPHVRVMDFTGRPLRGFVYVEAAGIGTRAALQKWVNQGVAFALTLPKKPKRKSK